jgi:crotonobetainyl-CoA:carnitine CoA-transferase CaiB-like acyl-CoA transferase
MKATSRSGFDFLQGLTVIEVSQLGPDAVGGHLADLGARVIKIESPTDGDPIRFAGEHAVGEPNGYGLLHLRWNRGKESVALDLRSAQGAAIFKQLIPRADLLIEGQRANALDRLGLGYSVLREINPRLVFCSVSGLGSTGPYCTLGSAAPSFDVYAGLHNAAKAMDTRYSESKSPMIAIFGTGLQAALAAIAAVWKAHRSGTGYQMEIAAADVASLWLPDAVDVALNDSQLFRRPGFMDEKGKLLDWPRMEFYRTRDSRVLFLQALKQKFWDRFCELAGKTDWVIRDERSRNTENERIWQEVGALFRTRSLPDWMSLLAEKGVPVIPANTFEDLANDPHFVARGNVSTVELESGQQLRLTSSPVRVAGQDFHSELAPALGQHTKRVLAELGLEDAAIAQLRAANVIA